MRWGFEMLHVTHPIVKYYSQPIPSLEWLIIEMSRLHSPLIQSTSARPAMADDGEHYIAFTSTAKGEKTD